MTLNVELAAGQAVGEKACQSATALLARGNRLMEKKRVSAVPALIYTCSLSGSLAGTGSRMLRFAGGLRASHADRISENARKRMGPRTAAPRN